jgi:hypothetical protein
MKDFFESVLGAYKSRYQNKFIGTFILFYLALNWEKVIAVFFLSEFSYQRFIFLWSMDWRELAIKISASVVLAFAYLFLAPMCSLLVHKMQSYALTEYKLQNIKNEKRIVKEKEKLEVVKGDLLAKERDNLEMEVDNSKINSDINVYNLLKSTLTEQDIMDLYLSLEREEKISYDMFKKLKSFFHDLSAAENTFSDGDLSSVADSMKISFAVLFEGAKKHRGYDAGGYLYSKEIIQKLFKEKDLIIKSYRDFIQVSKKVFSI